MRNKKERSEHASLTYFKLKSVGQNVHVSLSWASLIIVKNKEIFNIVFLKSVSGVSRVETDVFLIFKLNMYYNVYAVIHLRR